MTHRSTGDGRNLEYHPVLPEPGLTSCQMYQSGLHKAYPHNMGYGHTSLEDFASNFRIMFTNSLATGPEWRKTARDYMKQVGICQEVMKKVKKMVRTPPTVRLEFFLSARPRRFVVPNFQELDILQACKPEPWLPRWSRYQNAIKECLDPAIKSSSLIKGSKPPEERGLLTANAIATAMLSLHKLVKEFCPRWKSGVAPPKLLMSHGNVVDKVDPQYMMEASEDEKRILGMKQVLQFAGHVNDVLYVPRKGNIVNFLSRMREVNEKPDMGETILNKKDYLTYIEGMKKKFKPTQIEKARNWNKTQLKIGERECNRRNERRRSMIELTLEMKLKLPTDNDIGNETKAAILFMSGTELKNFFQNEILTPIIQSWHDDVRTIIKKQRTVHDDLRCGIRSEAISEKNVKHFNGLKRSIKDYNKTLPNTEKTRTLHYVKWDGDLSEAKFLTKPRKRILNNEGKKRKTEHADRPRPLGGSAKLKYADRPRPRSIRRINLNPNMRRSTDPLRWIRRREIPKQRISN